jgi:DNA invertase Pin-like site-specific DNA recombinase
MRVAVYVRVSTSHQVQQQTIEQQLTRLRAYVDAQGWTLPDNHIFRDDGYSGAILARPGLDCLRDRAHNREFDHVLLTTPDRLARNYVHQMVLIEEFAQVGCQVAFLDRPMSDDPHDHLLLQIRGAVAEYERTLIAERMRRGRLTKLQAGLMLPWTYPPYYGYRLHPDRPRDPSGVRLDPSRPQLLPNCSPATWMWTCRSPNWPRPFSSAVSQLVAFDVLDVLADGPQLVDNFLDCDRIGAMLPRRARRGGCRARGCTRRR